MTMRDRIPLTQRSRLLTEPLPAPGHRKGQRVTIASLAALALASGAIGTGVFSGTGVEHALHWLHDTIYLRIEAWLWTIHAPWSMIWVAALAAIALLAVWEAIGPHRPILWLQRQVCHWMLMTRPGRALFRHMCQESVSLDRAARVELVVLDHAIEEVIDRLTDRHPDGDSMSGALTRRLETLIALRADIGAPDRSKMLLLCHGLALIDFVRGTLSVPLADRLIAQLERVTAQPRIPDPDGLITLTAQAWCIPKPEPGWTRTAQAALLSEAGAFEQHPERQDVTPETLAMTALLAVRLARAAPSDALPASTFMAAWQRSRYRRIGVVRATPDTTFRAEGLIDVAFWTAVIEERTTPHPSAEVSILPWPRLAVRQEPAALVSGSEAEHGH